MAECNSCPILIERIKEKMTQIEQLRKEGEVYKSNWEKATDLHRKLEWDNIRMEKHQKICNLKIAEYMEDLSGLKESFRRKEAECRESRGLIEIITKDRDEEVIQKERTSRFYRGEIIGVTELNISLENQLAALKLDGNQKDQEIELLKNQLKLAKENCEKNEELAKENDRLTERCMGQEIAEWLSKEKYLMDLLKLENPGAHKELVEIRKNERNARKHTDYPTSKEEEQKEFEDAKAEMQFQYERIEKYRRRPRAEISGELPDLQRRIEFDSRKIAELEEANERLLKLFSNFPSERFARQKKCALKDGVVTDDVTRGSSGELSDWVIEETSTSTDN